MTREIAHFTRRSSTYFSVISRISERFLKSPISVGIVADNKKLSLTSRSLRFTRYPISVAMVPLKSGVLRNSCSVLRCVTRFLELSFSLSIQEQSLSSSCYLLLPFHNSFTFDSSVISSGIDPVNTLLLAAKISKNTTRTSLSTTTVSAVA